MSATPAPIAVTGLSARLMDEKRFFICAKLNTTQQQIMTILISVCIAIWLIKAIAQICIGLFQFLAGLIAMLIAVVLYVLAHAAEIIGALWITTFPSNLNNSTINKRST